MIKLLLILLIPAVLFAYECTVQRVIDGDTFVCSREKVRLIGVDTPESKLNRRAYKQRSFGDVNTVIRLGKLAKKFTETLIPPGTIVKLEFDVQKRDKYGRLLAYVWLPDGRMLNKVLLEEGYAVPLTIPPNTKYAQEFRKAYRYAVMNDVGLWNSPPKTYNQPTRRCGAKRYCSQMTSCEEAYFHYKTCGLQRLDRDRDGVPCESLCR